MYGLDNTSGVSVMPPLAPTTNPAPLWFTEGGAGQSPSYPGQDWFNQIQAEFLNVLSAANIIPNKENLSQLAEAFSQNLKKENNLSDLTNIPEALKNLGLLEAAKRDVGNGDKQIPDMSFFASSISGGYGYIMHPSGIIEQYIIVSVPGGQRQVTASSPIAWPTRCVDIQVTHYGSAAFYGTAVPGTNSTFTVHLQPAAPGAAASFFVKLTGY